jgi:hypothetical protein
MASGNDVAAVCDANFEFHGEYRKLCPFAE